MPSEASVDIQAADAILLEQLDHRESTMAHLLLAEARLHATKAVAAAEDRLAEALENVRFAVGR